MSAPLSQELFFNIHRGVALKGVHSSTDGLGVHWSTSHTVANSFARGNMSDFKTNSTHAFVYHGTAPISGVETDTKTLHDKAVYPPGSGHGYDLEKEVPLKKGTKVMIEGRTKLTRGSARKRTRRYKPPREMTA